MPYSPTDPLTPRRLLESWLCEDACPAIAAAIGSSERVEVSFGGRLRLDDPRPLPRDALFLIASPTKPLVALAILMLVEAGEVQLTEPVSRFVPAFRGSGKQQMTLAHCLTHTSGLPDKLPENDALRRQHAPLEAFVDHACRVQLAFPPGRGVQYQSIGFLMLGEVVRAVSGTPLPQYLSQRLFEPLGMQDTKLGLAADEPDSAAGASRTADDPNNQMHFLSERVAEIRVEDRHAARQWGWNSDYWRRFGAPWGGAFSSVDDLARLSQHLLRMHQGQPGIISLPTLDAMTRNQLESMPRVPESARRCTPWGYGWQRNWPNDPRGFGNLLSPDAYGHWGSTGAMLWIDPLRDRFAVVLSSQPLERDVRRFVRFSNAVSAIDGVPSDFSGRLDATAL